MIPARGLDPPCLTSERPITPTRAPRRVSSPDFCANRTVFPTVILAELFAFVLTLAERNNAIEFWFELALTSLFVQLMPA